MFAVLLVAALCAPGAPAADEARSLAAQKKWDELYLRFASVKPDGYGAAQRRTIGDALLAAAKNLAKEDKGLAFSAADLSARFEPKVATLVYAAELAKAIKSNGQAAAALDRALEIDTKSSKALIARAELAVEESDYELAVKLYERVPRSSSDFPKARAGAKAAHEALAERREAKGEVRRMENDLAHPKPRAPEGEPTDEAKAAASHELGLDGMRVRESPYFHFIYSGGGKDFAVRADYEGHVLEALDEARTFVTKEWGRARETPVDVVLYTKEEYDLHFGGSSLGRALGFYSGKIRVSNAADITPELRAVIVHEYTHAVVDAFTKSHPVPMWLQEGTATVVEMQYRGVMDGSSPPEVQTRLRYMAEKNRLPSLDQLNRSFVEMPNTMVAYHYSAAAVRDLMGKGGVSGYLDFLEQIGRGVPFMAAFAERYYPTLSDLDDEVRRALAHP